MRVPVMQALPWHMSGALLMRVRQSMNGVWGRCAAGQAAAFTEEGLQEARRLFETLFTGSAALEPVTQWLNYSRGRVCGFAVGFAVGS
jgi:hypothetical protein